MADTTNRACDILLSYFVSSDLLLVENLPKNQAYAYTHTINNIVNYVQIKIQKPIIAPTRTLQANTTQKIYFVMQKRTSILEVKKSIYKSKNNLARSVDALRAIFYPQNN